MAALRSEDILLDLDTVNRALKAPRAPQFGSVAPPIYRLEDRLPRLGPPGSVMPPTRRQLEAMHATYPPPRSSNRSFVLGLVLLALVAVIGAVVYRDVHHEAPASVGAASVSE